MRLEGIVIGWGIIPHETPAQTDITVVVTATGPNGEAPRCVGPCVVNAVLVVTDE